MPLLTLFSSFSARNCSTVSPGSQFAFSVRRSRKTCFNDVALLGPRHRPPLTALALVEAGDAKEPRVIGACKLRIPAFAHNHPPPVIDVGG